MSEECRELGKDDWQVLFRFEKIGKGPIVGECYTRAGWKRGEHDECPDDLWNFINSLKAFVSEGHDWEGNYVPGIRMKDDVQLIFEMMLEHRDIDNLRALASTPEIMYRAVSDVNPAFISLEDQAISFRENSKQPLEDEWYRHIKPVMLNLLEPYQKYDSEIYDCIYNCVYDVLFEKTTGSKP